MRHLRPTDDFCVVKSWSQATKEFAKEGFCGKVFLGRVRMHLRQDFPKFYIGPRPPETLTIVQWVCASPKGNVTLPTFLYNFDFSFYDQMEIIGVINTDAYIIADEVHYYYRYECVDIDGEKLDDWTIFLIQLVDNEEMAKIIAKVWGHEPLSAALHKCFLIEDCTSQTKTEAPKIIPLWQVKCVGGIYRNIPAFMDDYELLGEYDYDIDNTLLIPPGGGFTRNNQYHLVSVSDKGYCFTPRAKMTVSINKEKLPP